MNGGFSNEIIGGAAALVREAIQSPNFDLATQTGWKIDKNGDAWFFNITAEGSVTANTVIIKGSGDGVFIYDGLPGPGTLVLAIASASGSDQFGNPYSGPGMSLSFAGAQDIIQIRPDKKAMLVYG